MMESAERVVTDDVGSEHSHPAAFARTVNNKAVLCSQNSAGKDTSVSVTAALPIIFEED